MSPFLNKDANGRPNYDLTKSISTTVNFEGAYGLYDMANKLIQHPTMTGGVDIPCNGAMIRLERRTATPSEVFFTINKNNDSISFKFTSYQTTLNENGQQTQQTIESGLGAFAKTVEGYLTGINSDRHLDKLTEDYAKLRGGNQQGGPQRGNFPQNNYQRNNNYNNNYRKNNNGGNFQRRNNNWNNNQNRNNNQQSWETKPNTQNISSYHIQD
jgi:uncharacterized protein DDB_G0289917